MARRVSPKEPAPAPQRGAGLDEAKRLSGQGRHDEAAAACGKVIASMPGDRAARRLRAEAFRCAGRHAEALEDLDALARLDPDDAGAIVTRGEGRRHLSDFEGGLLDAKAAL